MKQPIGYEKLSLLGGLPNPSQVGILMDLEDILLAEGRNCYSLDSRRSKKKKKKRTFQLISMRVLATQSPMMFERSASICRSVYVWTWTLNFFIHLVFNLLFLLGRVS